MQRGFKEAEWNPPTSGSISVHVVPSGVNHASEQEIGETNKLKRCLTLHLNNIARIRLLMMIANRKDALGETPQELVHVLFVNTPSKYDSQNSGADLSPLISR